MWTQGVDNIVSFSRAQLLELWYGILEDLLQLLLTKDYLVELRRPLWFGSSQVNRSVFNTLSIPPLAAVSHSMLIISLSVLLVVSHCFEVPVTLVPTVQPFSVLSC